MSVINPSCLPCLDAAKALCEALVAVESIRAKAESLPPAYRTAFAFTLRLMASEFDARTARTGTTTQRIEAFFRDRGNLPATLTEIEHGTGLPYLSVRGYVQKRAPQRFVAVKAEAGQAGLWKWKSFGKN